MAKLYWRVKRDGKWTWRSAKVLEKTTDFYLQVENYVEGLE